jgi:hypothetical protein
MNEYESQFGNYTQTQDDNSAVHEVILDNSYIIDELMHTLRGEIVDTNTNSIIHQGEALVDENAITWLVGRFVPYTSKIFSLSVLDEREIKEIIFEFETDISLELMFPENIGIKRKNRNYVKGLLVHAFVATMYKALGGETLKKLLEQHHVSESTIRQESEKKGFWNKQREVTV